MGIIRRNGTTQEALLRKAHLGSVDNAEEIFDLAKHHGICLTPLDVEKLASVLGIKIHTVPLDNDISGSLSYDTDEEQWVMKVNSLHHITRQRFTIAHEIGHYILHRKDKTEFIDKAFFRDNSINRYELEANNFAGEILMPRSEFLEFISKVSDKVADIAVHFEVSPLAVEVRAKQIRSIG